MQPFIHPAFDPVALQLGPIAIHWYGLSYVVALLGCLWLAKVLTRRNPAKNLTPDTLEDAFIWVALGVILGGRLGYVLFYNPLQYLHQPLEILKVWQGGMSFHGGALGVALAMVLFSLKRKIHVADLADRVATVVPFGILCGRIANFVNGELWGRPTTVESTPWAMVFPHVDMLPRHPSQLYEAALEGALLLALLWLLSWKKGVTRWLPTGVFLLGYGLARMFVEIFRTPEITHDLGPIFITQGQLLSLPMVAAGLVLIAFACRGRK